MSSELSGERDFLLALSQSKLQGPSEHVWLRPVPCWPFSAPRGPCLNVTFLDQAKVMVLITAWDRHI